MALNWSAFLTDETLNQPDHFPDQWADPPPTTTGLSPEMPKSTSARRSSSGLADLTGFDPLANATGFDDALFNPNDYFLSDLEVLPPFGNTLTGGETTEESSPEPASGIALTGPFTSKNDISSASQTSASTSTDSNMSPQATAARKMTVQRAQSFPNPTYESMFPNNIDTGFVEDLTFPNGPSGAVHSSKSSVDNTSTTAANTTAKRNRTKPDILSACWTSPLCPNHDQDQDGPPPNPSSCGGGCGPFLFADDTLPTPTANSLLPEPQEVTAEDGIVEIQPRSRKRTESDASSSLPSGRQFLTVNTVNKQRPLKTESIDSPPETAQSIDDAKPKSRRRLPHNQVERKYRESLNTQLESLRRVVPSLQQNACDGADIEDLPAPSKPSKAVILASATAHIKQIEKDKKSLQDENQLLRTRMKALQALVKCEDCSLMQYVMDLKINQQK